MGIEVAIMAASLAVGVAGAVDARNKGKEAVEIQKEQAETQKSAEYTQLHESRRQQLREERVRRAKVLQAAENTGVGGSSGEATAIGNLGTRIAGNLAFQTGQTSAAERITSLGVNLASTQESQATSQAVSGLGFNVFQIAGSFAGKPKTETTPTTPTTPVQ